MSTRKLLILIFAFFSICKIGTSQVPMNKDIQLFYDSYFSKNNDNISSSIPPFTLDSNFTKEVDSLGVYTGKYWLFDRLLDKELVRKSKKDYSYVLNPYINLDLGIDTENGSKVVTNKRGLYFNGRFYKKLEVFFSISENLSFWDSYQRDYVKKYRIHPGEGVMKFNTNGYSDNLSSTGLINYTPNKFINVEFGHGKNFIGSGYRSLILSDNASNYPFAKFKLQFGNVRYYNLVAEFLHYDNAVVTDQLRKKKYGSFHVLSMKLFDKIDIELVEAVIWGGDSLSRSTFDVNYLNPFVSIRAVERNLGSPDNVLIALNGNWKLNKNFNLYGQFLLDEFYAKELFGGNNWWGNKYAFQAGFKASNFKGKLKGLSGRLEYNYVRPFTYTHKKETQGLTHLNQPLAHPSGANLEEYIGRLNYHINRFNFQYTFIRKRGGRETNDSTSIGEDVTRSYEERLTEYDNIVGQGDSYVQNYHNVKLSYLVNPSSFTFFDIGLIYRSDNAISETRKNNIIYAGLRTALFNYYNDF